MSNSSTQGTVIAIIVKNYDALNTLLHEYSAYIISVALDAIEPMRASVACSDAE